MNFQELFNIKFSYLGNSDLKVSEICLGVTLYQLCTIVNCIHCRAAIKSVILSANQIKQLSENAEASDC